MTLTTKDAPGISSSGKQGSASQNSESGTGESPRTNPVCLDVAVTIRSLPNEANALSKAIREEVRTVIVFDNGAVIRCAESLPVGYTVILTNSNARDVVCRVVTGRNLPNIKGYVEVQFLESVNNFWSTHQDNGVAAPVAPAASPVPNRPATASELTSKSAPLVSLAAPKLDDLGGLSSIPESSAHRESQAKPQRPGPELVATNASSYSHSENTNPSSIGNWNSSVSEPPAVKQANPEPRESSAANSSASTTAPSRDFMSKGLMAYDKAEPSAAAAKGRAPLIVGAAVLALAAVAGVAYFMHQGGAPASVATSANISKTTASQSPAAPSAPEPAPAATAEATSSAAMNSQAAAQPVAVEQSQSVATPNMVPAVVTGPVTSDSKADARNARRPEKNAIAPKQPVPSASPKPAMTNLKMSSPSAPANKVADIGGAAAPITETAAPEAAAGSPSAGLLTASGRISNPPAPPSAPAPVATTPKTVTAPKLISSGRLVYPQSARQSSIQGTVTVLAMIDETGKVVSAKALNGPLLLREAAVNSVKEWKYAPSLLDGKPVPSQVTVGVEFKLN
jgi:TonB family protein